ncbi:hypothetical protein FA95DRAFT_1004974 [Auriscalpium vulgare]|uniref:Uncharacterized protein n=1 Tax=Auriscalpium vulgare TaxID=40419 RepID=A0ACB8RY12_9AGAM|nr:hypothetical protein FA95DRAFT_1004974 [Auriscalpium vulgare]
MLRALSPSPLHRLQSRPNLLPASRLSPTRLLSSTVSGRLPTDVEVEREVFSEEEIRRARGPWLRSNLSLIAYGCGGVAAIYVAAVYYANESTADAVAQQLVMSEEEGFTDKYPLDRDGFKKMVEHDMDEVRLLPELLEMLLTILREEI